MNKILVKIVRGIMLLLSQLPLKVHYFFGDILSFLAMNVIKYRYDVVMVNLSRSFPDKKYKELKKIASDFYRHFGEIFAEAIWFGGSDYKRLQEQGIVTVVNPEVASECFSNSPSLTVLNSHCGNWELLGGFLGYPTKTGEGYSFGEEHIAVVYKELHNKMFDEVFRYNRAAALETVGIECEIESTKILRFSMKHKDVKKVYIYPTDQYPYSYAKKYPMGIFMNQQTDAMVGSVGIACKMSHAVVYLKMKHVARGKYEMEFIKLADNAADHTPEEIMRKYYDVLEAEINETPHNWLWTHKRWK